MMDRDPNLVPMSDDEIAAGDAEYFDDDDDDVPTSDAAIKATADKYAAEITDEDEPGEVDEGDGEPAAEPSGEPSWRQDTASPPTDFGALQVELQQAVAADPDLALAARFAANPYEYERFARERPQEFIQWRHRAEGKVMQVAQIEQQIALAMQAEQRDRLAKAIPEIADPKTGRAVKEDMRRYLKSKGFNDREIDGIADHRVVVALSDAVRYSKMAEPAKKRGGRSGLPKNFANKSIFEQADIIAKLI